MTKILEMLEPSQVASYQLAKKYGPEAAGWQIVKLARRCNPLAQGDVIGFVTSYRVRSTRGYE